MNSVELSQRLQVADKDNKSIAAILAKRKSLNYMDDANFDESFKSASETFWGETREVLDELCNIQKGTLFAVERIHICGEPTGVFFLV